MEPAGGAPAGPEMSGRKIGGSRKSDQKGKAEMRIGEKRGGAFVIPPEISDWMSRW